MKILVIEINYKCSRTFNTCIEFHVLLSIIYRITYVSDITLYSVVDRKNTQLYIAWIINIKWQMILSSAILL